MGDEIAKNNKVAKNAVPIIEKEDVLTINSGSHTIKDFWYSSFKVNGGKLNVTTRHSVDTGDIHGGEVIFKSFSDVDSVFIYGGKTNFDAKYGFKDWVIFGGDNSLKSLFGEGYIAIEGGVTKIIGGRLSRYEVDMVKGRAYLVGRYHVDFKNMKSDDKTAVIYFSQKTPITLKGRKVCQNVYVKSLPEKLDNIRFVFEKGDLGELRRQFSLENSVYDVAWTGNYSLSFDDAVMAHFRGKESKIMNCFATTQLSWDDFKSLSSDKVIKNIQIVKK